MIVAFIVIRTNGLLSIGPCTSPVIHLTLYTCRCISTGRHRPICICHYISPVRYLRLHDTSFIHVCFENAVPQVCTLTHGYPHPCNNPALDLVVIIKLHSQHFSTVMWFDGCSEPRHKLFVFQGVGVSGLEHGEAPPAPHISSMVNVLYMGSESTSSERGEPPDAMSNVLV